jgi:Holliday junction resolvasome RuvABC endonuclease subunit
VGEFLFVVSPAALGIDVGSRIVGLCLMRGDGQVFNTWSVKVNGEPLQRLCTLYEKVRDLFASIQALKGDYEKPHVFIEREMLYDRPNATKVSAMHGEVRGVLMALAWARGWPVHKMAVGSWKTQLSKEERTMAKDAAYVEYWNGRAGTAAESPDEIDAYFIARRAIIGGGTP